jgi:hypothetical protein
MTPVIGFLNIVSHDGFGRRLRAFRQGLKERGYVEGRTSRGLSASQSGVIAVASVSTIISGKASEATPISVWTGSGAVPKFLLRHWP